MAITINTWTLKRPPTDSAKFIVPFYSADASGTEEILAAVTGKAHYITKIKLHCASAITVSIGGGETTGALTTTLVGPIPFAASTGEYNYEFPDEALMVAKATAICIDASGAGAVEGVIEGVTGPVFP